jgi:hypothetical protein
MEELVNSQKLPESSVGEADSFPYRFEVSG